MKYRASAEILGKKLLGFLQCISDKSVRFDSYLCQFDFKKKTVEIHEKELILLEGNLIGKNSFSKLQKIIIDDCVISIKRPKFSLVAFRDVSIISKDYVININGLSSSLDELNIGIYGNIKIDYLGRWIDCDFNKKYLMEAMVITSFIYLFCNENRVSEGG
jgi:hypothetical protein